jgi:hypothetical protein
VLKYFQERMPYGLFVPDVPLMNKLKVGVSKNFARRRHDAARLPAAHSPRS